MRKIIFGFLSAFTVLFAADVTLAQSDFVERLINFVLFALILWYFGANKIKEIFVGRTRGISEMFQKMQEEEQQIRREKEKAKLDLEEARQKASELIALAKRETYLITQKFEDRLDREIKSLNLSYEQKLAQEEKMMVEEEVHTILQNFANHLDVSHCKDYYGEVLCKGLKQ